MSTDLIQWSQIDSEIAAAKDFEIISQLRGSLDMMEVLAKQRKESLQVRNRIEAYRIQLSWAAAELYSNLSDKRGRRAENDTEATSKQEALQELQVSKMTMSKWVDSLSIPRRRQYIRQYEAYCNEHGEPVSLRGFNSFVEPLVMPNVTQNEVITAFREIEVTVENGEIQRIDSIPQYMRVKVIDKDLSKTKYFTKENPSGE